MRDRQLENRNRRLRFSPEVKTETEPKLRVGYFLAPSVLVRFDFRLCGTVIENLNFVISFGNL